MLSATERRFFSWQLTRYVGGEVLFSFLAGTMIFLLILLAFQAIRLSDFVIGQQVPMREVAKLGLYLLLSFLPIAIPVAFLFAVLMGISRANSEGEIIALQASGVGLKHIFFPLGAMSLIVGAISLYTSLYSVPWGNRAFELLFSKWGQQKLMAALKPNVFIEGFHGLVLFAEQIIPVRNEMKRVFIYDDREGDHPVAVTAKGGILRSNAEQGGLTLRLTDGSIHVDKRASPGPRQRIDFKVYDINLELAEGSDGWRRASPPSLNYPELVQRIGETVNNQRENIQLQVELHRRFALAFACLVFSALGFTIGTLSQRGLRSAAIVLCLAVGVTYWVAVVAANVLASGGWIAPWIGVWSPNVLFSGVAYYCYRRQT